MGDMLIHDWGSSGRFSGIALLWYVGGDCYNGDIEFCFTVFGRLESSNGFRIWS